MLRPQESKQLQGAVWHTWQEGIEIFRQATGSTDIPLHTFYLFLFMPKTGPGITVSNLVNMTKGLDLSQAAISRNVLLLAGKSKLRNDGGLDLVEYQEDHQDRRHKLYRLNKHGVSLREHIEQRMVASLKRYMHWEDGEDGTDTQIQAV